MSRSKAIRLAFAFLAVGFFAVPVALRAVGVTAEAFENRRFAEAPALAQGWDAFEQTTQFLIDRMPLRAQAVRANTRIWKDVFDTDPRYAGQPTLGQDQALPFAGAAEGEPTGEPAETASQVLSGKDGWLFLAGEQQNACAPPLPPDEALRRWAKLVSTVRASGRQAVLLVAPDKGSVYPEYLPDDYANADCARAAKEVMWGLFEQIGPGLGVIALRKPLLRAKREGPTPVYLRKDSHWSAVGSLEMVRAALDRFGGGVTVGPEDVKRGESEYTGDLTTLIGAAEEDTRPERVVDRPAGAPHVEAPAVLVGDSYGALALPQLSPYFTDLRSAPWFSTPTETLIGEIERARIVIFETVERDVAFRASDVGPASPGFVEALRRELR